MKVSPRKKMAMGKMSKGYAKGGAVKTKMAKGGAVKKMMGGGMMKKGYAKGGAVRRTKMG